MPSPSSSSGNWTVSLVQNELLQQGAFLGWHRVPLIRGAEKTRRCQARSSRLEPFFIWRRLISGKVGDSPRPARQFRCQLEYKPGFEKGWRAPRTRVVARQLKVPLR